MPGGVAQLAVILFRAPPFGWLGSLIIALSIVVALLAYTTGFRWRTHSQPTRFGLLAMRLGAIVCLLLTLLHPAWVSERSVDEKPIVAVVLDDSASMSQATERRSDKATAGPAHGVGAAGDKTTRYTQAVAVLCKQMAPALAENHRVRLYDVQARALRPDDLPAVATGKRSPLTDTLLRVQYDLRDDPLVGIALLSDGAETADQPTFGGVEQLRVPVYAIDVAGSSQESPATVDLSIQAVSANRRALVGNTVRVVVDIAAESDPGDARFPVSILDGGEPVASRMARWQPGDGSPVRNRRHKRVELEFVPRRPGQFTYAVAIGALPGEADLANNRETFPLTVRAKPLTVLYIDGVLRWEGKFIREALAADPDINVISSVRTARVGADHGSPGLLLAEQLANVDVVILGDVEASYFGGREGGTGILPVSHRRNADAIPPTPADEELQALRTWVTDGGGGLVLTGGYRSFGPTGFGRTTLRDILPVEFSASASPQIERPVNLRLTEAGRAHPIFSLTGDPVRDTAFIHRLPALNGCSRVAGIKPGAEVLAVSSQVGGPDEQKGLPIMAVQQVGAGRAMVFAVDTTWRWRLVVGGFTGDSSFYERFWGQLVRWMASEQEEPAPQLFVSTDQSRYKLGQTIELNVELGVGLNTQLGDEPRASARAALRMPASHRSDDSEAARAEARGSSGRGASSTWKVAARALDESGKQMNVPLAELGHGKYCGRLAAGQPGRLDLTVTAEPVWQRFATGGSTAWEPASQSRMITVQVERPDPELLNPRCDPQWLARVAQLSGGHLVPPDQIDTWASQLPADPVRKTEVRTSGTRGDWLFGSAFLLLICAEWIVRRRSQLA